mmetsp:Transcript_14841/g.46017  ORF Transcript_14841/g.46017 Transcript_14841/m.46017 type:complete len:288 (-) Transcript_14841:578-1441(-)
MSTSLWNPAAPIIMHVNCALATVAQKIIALRFFATRFRKAYRAIRRSYVGTTWQYCRSVDGIASSSPSSAPASATSSPSAVGNCTAPAFDKSTYGGAIPDPSSACGASPFVATKTAVLASDRRASSRTDLLFVAEKSSVWRAAGSACRMPSRSRWKPSARRRSASSMTKCVSVRRIVHAGVCCTWSSKRPGVPMAMLQASRRLRSSLTLVPPVMSSHVTDCWFFAPKRRKLQTSAKTLRIWAHSSFVGDMTRAVNVPGATPGAARARIAPCSTGTAKARVLPEPVLA